VKNVETLAKKKAGFDFVKLIL